MLSEKLTEYSDYRTTLQRQASQTPTTIDSLKARLDLMAEQLTELDPASEKFKELSKKLQEGRIEKETLEAIAKKQREKLSNFHSLPEVIAMRQGIANMMDSQILEMENKKKAIEAQVNELMDKATELTTDYFSLQIEQRKLLDNTRQALDNPALQTNTHWDSREASRLMQRDFIDSEIRKRYKSR